MTGHLIKEYYNYDSSLICDKALDIKEISGNYDCTPICDKTLGNREK